MKSCPQSSPGSLGCQVSRQGRNGFCIVTRIVGELHRYGLRGSLRDRSIELLNGSLSLNTLVKTDEAHTFREAGNRTLLRAAWKREMWCESEEYGLQLVYYWTWNVITQYPAGNDVPTGGEQSLKVRLGHVLREAGHVEVGALDGLAAWPGERYLEGNIGQSGLARTGGRGGLPL